MASLNSSLCTQALVQFQICREDYYRQGTISFSSLIITITTTTTIEVVIDINRIAFKFLRRDQDRVVRTAMINSYGNGGLRVLDLETLIKSLRLSAKKVACQ